ncbi:hypothetical protein EV644_106109 [Kribbella orskensis]|uniref:Uncharacterized protein n=1 Tax=Kribbella orskensis TaxID=2512216 RepID=A0ABY2BLL6_9ACTN|nr:MULTISPECIES: hypothetical protein [Kribbella]TCN40181.1 hypothetical protein EV642_105109 [Kribbella sp. VKM Ac-2500]TCO22801.1 hypothetical protein EV644_106109 [Kribbella orskensis]
MKPFSEEEQAERRRFGRKRGGLRRIAVLVAAPAGVYAVLVSVSLLGGPRLGAPLIPLPGGGVDATSPIAGPQPSRLPAKNFPSIPPEVSNPTVPPAVLPTVAPSTTGPSTGSADGRSTTGRSADDPSTSGRWNERSVANSWPPGSADRPAEPQVPGSSTTNPAEHPDPSIPPATKTPPPPPPTTDPPLPPDTPSNPPGNPEEPDQPSLTDALLGLLDKIL